MTEQEIHRILEKGEGITVEFKRAGSSLPKSLFETVSAFLNRNGGTILLGPRGEGSCLQRRSVVSDGHYSGVQAEG